MTPSGLVESVVQRRLTMIDRLVGAAESRRGITGEELDRDFDTRLIVERILTQLADLAVDINAHITSSLGETAGGEARSTFDKMAQLGIIPLFIVMANLAQIAGAISGVARGLAVALNGVPSGLAQVTKAVADQKEAA